MVVFHVAHLVRRSWYAFWFASAVVVVGVRLTSAVRIALVVACSRIALRRAYAEVVRGSRLADVSLVSVAH